MANVKTISLKDKQGRHVANYAKVASRLAEFIANHKNGVIKKSYQVVDGYVIFKAEIFIQNVLVADGHSSASITGVKTLEKCETIATGRALAFYGIQADGNIASAVEMEDFDDVKNTNEYVDAKYQLEDLIDKCTVVNVRLEKIKSAYEDFTPHQLNKAIEFIKQL